MNEVPAVDVHLVKSTEMPSYSHVAPVLAP
jgi:hypothetical protein